MAPFQWGFNLDLELERLLGAPEISVPMGVLRELDRLSLSERDARSARMLAGHYGTWTPGRVRDEDVSKLGSVDASLLEGGRDGWIVTTMDRPLIRKLVEEESQVISLREKKRLEFI